MIIAKGTSHAKGIGGRFSKGLRSVIPVLENYSSGRHKLPSLDQPNRFSFSPDSDRMKLRGSSIFTVLIRLLVICVFKTVHVTCLAAVVCR